MRRASQSIWPAARDSLAPLLSLALAACLANGEAAWAQPADLPVAAATTDQYPPGIRVAQTPKGPVYVNSRGQVLYGMDMRVLLRANPDPSQYCAEDCLREWEPVLAPANSLPNIRYPRNNAEQRATSVTEAGRTLHTPRGAPDWSIIAGPEGPQWVYKGWHMVFTRRGERAGAASFDGADNHTWNTLKFRPPVPALVAPQDVKPVFLDGRYVLATDDGRVLFTGRCRADCSSWAPLQAGMASASVGQWTVKLEGDYPQWAYRGKPVFVSQDDRPGSIPAEGAMVQP